MVFNNQYLGLRWAYYYIFCLYGYLSIFMEKHWFIPMHLIPFDPRVHSNFIPFHICTSFYDSEKPNTHYPQLTWSLPVWLPFSGHCCHPCSPYSDANTLCWISLSHGCPIQPTWALVPQPLPPSPLQTTLSLCSDSDTLQWANFSYKYFLSYALVSTPCTVP